MTAHQTSTVRAQTPGDQAQHWEQRGACRDKNPDLFHTGDDSPPGQPPQQWEWAALEICWACPVVARCLHEALLWPVEHQHGVAGGMTAGQRKAVLEHRGDAPAKTSGQDVVDLSDLPTCVDLRLVQALLDGLPALGAGRGERAWAAVALRRGGWPARRIAAHLRVSERTVHGWLTEAKKETAA